MLRPRRACNLAAFSLLGTLAVGCGGRGAVTFDITAPDNALFSPVAPPANVSEYDIRTSTGSVIGIASAVESSSGGDSGKLPLGALMTEPGPVDVFVTALSGGSLLGEARIKDVTIKKGLTHTYEADLRKPLVFVGSALPAEVNGANQLKRVEILDPVASTDLAAGGQGAPSIPALVAGAVSWDGRFLFAASPSALAVFDTGAGTMVNGSTALDFAPTRMAVAPRDNALVLLGSNGPDGVLGIISDVAALAGNPNAAAVDAVTLTKEPPRAVAFSPDGQTIYVLGGGADTDPCTPGTTPAPNDIVVVGIDGTIKGTLNLPSFVSDLTVDPASGRLVLADATRGQISTLDLTTTVNGPVAPAVLADKLTCPSAVRVVDGAAIAVTSTLDMTQANAFLIERVPLTGNATATALSFVGPQFLVPVLSTPSSNGDIQTVNLPVRPASIEAYELAITPDGSRAEFATRAHYLENGTKFTLSQVPCTAQLDIIEYGLYAVDLRTGNASYTLRSQLVQRNAQDCIDCSDPVNGDEQVECQSIPGDRPAGLAASFGS